MSLTIMDEDKI